MDDLKDNETIQKAAKEFREKKKREDPDNKFLKRREEMNKESEEKRINKIRDRIIDKRNEGIFELSKYLIEKYSIITLQDTDDIFIYENGIYIARGDKILSSRIQYILKGLVNTNMINETLGHIKRSSYKKRKDIVEPIDKICLENGILDINTLEVVNHTPDIIFFNKINVDYRPSLSCNNIIKFLKEVIPEDSINLIQEFLGYCLYKKYKYHKAIMLVGSGANGKSTFCRLVKEFLGFENCVSIPLQHLEVDKFAASNLFGKLANIYADLPSRALKETSMFKMILGEDLIPGEKKFKDKFFFENYSKQIFSCNQIPKSPEDSDAFFRRWIIITFPNQFLGNKADSNLIDKLTTPEELSGLLNFAIQGLKKLMENKGFSDSNSIQQVREQYIRMSDSVASFNMDCIEINPDGYIPKKEIYTLYTDYCRKMGYPIVPDTTFHRDLQKQIRVEDYRPNLDIDGKKQRVQCWRGIKVSFNTAFDPDIPDIPDINTKDVKGVKDVKDFFYLSDSKIGYEDVKDE